MLQHDSDPAKQFVSIQRLYAGDDENGQEASASALMSTPILLEHSRDDDVISIDSGERMKDTLGNLGFEAVEWNEYEGGGHWINEPQGVDDFAAFLRRVMDR